MGRTERNPLRCGRTCRRPGRGAPAVARWRAARTRFGSTSILNLHPELRAPVDEVLSTRYLSEAEGAYQRGEIADYYLFPTDKLQRGAYVPLCRATDKPLSRITLREKFAELEAIVGVEHRKGQAFYGLRRQTTNLAPEFAQDAQVLNRIFRPQRQRHAGTDLPRPAKRASTGAGGGGAPQHAGVSYGGPKKCRMNLSHTYPTPAGCWAGPDNVDCGRIAT
jgi:hypothetical protein